MLPNNIFCNLNTQYQKILIVVVGVIFFYLAPINIVQAATPPCPQRSSTCAGLGSRPDDRAEYCDNNLNGNQDPGEPDIPFSGCCAPFYPGDDQYCRGDGGGPPVPPEPVKLACEETRNVDCGADGTQCGRVSGKILKVRVNEQGRQTDEDDAPLEGVGVAWIEGAFLEIKSQYQGINDGSKTYKYTQSDEQGRFSLVGLDPKENAVLGIFCGKRLIETVGIEWGKMGNDVKLPERTFVYTEDLDCTANDFCYRIKPESATDRCEAVSDPDQFKVYFPWGDPPSLNRVATLAEVCLSNLATCIQELQNWTGGCLRRAVGNDASLEMNVLSTDWFAPYQAIVSMFGAQPSTKLPSCDELAEIKASSSRLNLPRGGMTAIASARPSGSSNDPNTWGRVWRMCWNAYTTPGEEAMDRQVCKLNGREEPVTLKEIQFPLSRELDGNDVLSKNFFPYWLCGTGFNDGGYTEARGVPRVSNTTDEFSCAQPNQDGGCDYGEDVPTEANTQSPVSLTPDGADGERTTSLKTANKANDVLPYGRPGRLLNERAPQRAAKPEEAGFSRARVYGEECTCPENRVDDYTGEYNATSVCRTAGVRFNVVTCINDSLDRIIQCGSPNPPPGINCDLNASSNTTIDVSLPYVERISNVFANMSSGINRPGSMVTESACLGTVTGTTDETRERVAYSSGGCSSVRRPRDLEN